MTNQDAIIRNERTVSFSPETIFAAFQDEEKLAKWWGPEGFTNTFETFEFRTGGRWVFVMHGPDDTHYDNECVFDEVSPHKITIRHIPLPHFVLTIELTPEGDQTHISWIQAFETAEVAEQVRSVCEPANEQNLDRLEDVCASMNI